MIKHLSGVSALALVWAAGAASAQSAPSPLAAGTSTGASEVSEVIVTGTRQSGVRAADSAQPIQVVGQQALQHIGQPDITQALQQTVPSFNVRQGGGDTAALTIQAALRGLNPNDTLVLVDGKRRHSTANLSVDSGSPYSGAATVDLSYIPSGAIDHVEVLTDGAAAQYGSDAIAGVVNIILKTADHGGSISATGGQYFEGDGGTGAWFINKGLNLNDRGFVNFTVEERYHDGSRQGGGDRRLSNPDGSLLSTLSAIDKGAANQPGYPNINNINGDTRYNIYDGFYNAAYDLDGGVQIYSFGSYGQRIASAFENYRVPSKVLCSPTTKPACPTIFVPFPTGFEPREQFKETDYSFTGGLKGTTAEWHWDLSSTYGEDRDDIYTINSANAQLFPVLQSLSSVAIVPQTNFYDGQFKNNEWDTSLNIDRSLLVGFLASPLNVAFGGEYRKDIFHIGAGEPSSYFGAGAQSFDGYTKLDQGGHGRSNYAFYLDLAADPIKNLHIDLAGRYENYSDFGDDTVGKVTARYDLTPMIAFRGTVSTGFRAPTLQEEFYSGTNVAPTSANVQLPANSAAAALAGFSPLKPEQSSNYSGGVVLHLLSNLQITADYYQILLHDRILGSGFIYGSSGATTVSQGVLNAITKQGVTLDSGLSYAGISVFSNAANTKTQGVEFTATYASDFGDYGHVDWSVGFNYNTTQVTKLFALPATVTNVGFGQTAILTPSAISGLITGAPEEKAILNAYWTHGKFSVNLREEVYGQSSELISFNGSGNPSTFIVPPNTVATPYGASAGVLKVGATGITDIDIGYKITPRLRLNVGANNLFDQRPPNTPTVLTSPTATTTYRPQSGGNVYGAPAGFSPYGINGGYYYGRMTFTF